MTRLNKSTCRRWHLKKIYELKKVTGSKSPPRNTQWAMSLAKEGWDDWLMDGLWPTIKWAYASINCSILALQPQHLTQCMCSFDYELITAFITWIEQPHCVLLSFLICLSSVLWRCLASMKNNSAMLEWCYPARAFSRALGFWPHSITCIGTQSICTSMKSFHAIKKEIKSESLSATFFSSPDCITKEHRNNGGIGLLQALNWDVLLKCRALLWGHADCGPIFSK